MTQPAPNPTSAAQPIIGPDGELLEADPHIDPAAYDAWVAGHAAPEINLDVLDRRNRIRTLLWVVPLVIVILLLIIANPPRGVSSIPSNAEQNVPQSVNRLVLPQPGQMLELQLPTLETPLALSWSPRNDQLAIMSRKHDLKLWNEEQGFQMIRERIETFAWSPDGRSLLVVDDQRLNLLAISEAGNPATDLTPIPTLKTEWNQVKDIIWSPNGRYLAVNEGGWLRMVEVSSGAVLHSMPIGFVDVLHLQWADNQRLVGVVDGAIWEWSFATMSAVPLPLPQGNHRVRQIIPLFDRNEWLVLTSLTSLAEILRLTADFTQITGRLFGPGIRSIQGPQSGNWLTLATDYEVTLYRYQGQLHTPITWWSPQGRITGVDWSADGRYIAIGTTDSITLWSPAG